MFALQFLNNMSNSEPIRVHALLSQLNAVERTALKKLMPRRLGVPEEPDGVRYPTALLAALPKGEEYSLAGHITEDMLRLPPVDVTADRLVAVATARYPALNGAKVVNSKTTEPYLEHIRQTRMKIRMAARGVIRGEEEVGTGGPVVGHPDMRTADQIFEIKMTGQLKQNWPDFLFQVFCYAALDPAVNDVYLVLPLQEIVWHCAVHDWANRAAFRDAIYAAANRKNASQGAGLAAALLIANYRIGSHMSKQKSLVDTVCSLPTDRPSQIFLAGPQSSHLNIADAELTGARAAVTSRAVPVYIHSAYIINLCTSAGVNDDFHTTLLRKTLRYGTAMGARGVVVHVGKSTTQDLQIAMANMRSNIIATLEDATTDCPLLLETPAGQGTEVLRTWAEFAAFVADINDDRLRVCIDTCHVFACGANPLDYLQRFLAEHPSLTKLIHFNDSATPCGSCLDRHAFCGEGHIGIEGMTAIATAAHNAGLPMVIE